jgi:prevent-host-death family protein
MDITRDIQTLSEFKQNASRLIKQVQETKQPVVLTVNGKPAAIVQDVETYQRQRLADEREYLETIAVLRERLADLDDPEKWLTHEEVFDSIRTKYNIPKP